MSSNNGNALPGKISFSKEKILGMERYRNRTDLLTVLLKDGESYEFAKVDKMIRDFERGGK